VNTNTGEIRALEDISAAEFSTGQWVPVSDDVVRIVKTGQRVEARRRKRKAAKAARRRNRGR
jgi:hypothetical protein